MYIVRLNPRLLEVNAAISASPALGGTVHNGYNEITAAVAPGTSGTVTVSFDLVVPSVSAPTFDLYRETLRLDPK